MDQRRWIVAGTDFSPIAEGALERAAALASALGAGLACVHAYEDPPGARFESDPSPAIQARLESAVAGLRSRFPAVRIECIVRRRPLGQARERRLRPWGGDHRRGQSRRTYAGRFVLPR